MWGLGSFNRGDAIVSDFDFCGICGEQVPAESLRVCPGCATDICGACQCEICHKPEEEKVFCSSVDGLATDGDNVTDGDQWDDGNRWDSQGGFLPTSDWITREAAAIRAEWTPEELEIRRARTIGLGKMDLVANKHYTIPQVRVLKGVT